MEYLLVRFREDRRVIVDGHYQGATNKVIEIEGGSHAVTLDAPYDFAPDEWTIVLADTAVISPHELQFT